MSRRKSLWPEYSFAISCRVIIAGVAIALLGGCGEWQSPISGPAMMPQGGARTARFQIGEASITENDPLGQDSLRYLFVASDNAGRGHVSIYKSGGSEPLTLIRKGILRPNALAVDDAGDLYVANHGTIRKQGTVSVYAPLTGKLLRTITNGVYTPDALALDKSGNVYVADANKSSVTEYAAGSTRLLRTITDGVGRPNAIAFDQSGKVYVSDYSGRRARRGAVTVYDGRTGRLLNTITAGVSYPFNLTLSPAGQLFVSNSTKNSVTIYNHDLQLVQTITAGIDYPSSLLVDGQGYLYVLNALAHVTGDVTVYPPGASSPSVTITDGIDIPGDMRLGPSGTLFVANLNACTFGGFCNHGSVVVYTRTTGKLLREMKAGISNPAELVLGP